MANSPMTQDASRTITPAINTGGAKVSDISAVGMIDDDLSQVQDMDDNQVNRSSNIGARLRASGGPVKY